MSFGGPFRSARDLPVVEGSIGVRWINREGRAYREGVRTGDRIVAINGRPVSRYGPEALMRVMGDDTMREITILREGQSRRITFR